MFYEIPANRTGMSAAQLRTHRLEARKSLLAALRAEDKPEKDAVDAYQAQIDALSDEITATDAIETEEAEQAAAAAIVAQASDAPADDDDDDDPDVVDEDPVVDDTAAGRAAQLTVIVPSGTDLAASTEVAPVERLRPDAIIATETTSGASGVRSGQAYDSWGDFGLASLARARNVSPGTKEKFELGAIQGRYDEAHTLTDSAFDNLRKLPTLGMWGPDTSADELMAAVCAPATPSYQMACLNTTRRPVAASLPGYAAPRGNVTIYPSPSLSDVAGSAGIWTQEDDADSEAEKNDCARIECSTSDTFGLYGVYWCFTVKNMELLTFPELVEAYMNRGMANYARLAETQLLDAMGAGVGQVNTTALGYNATVRISTQIMNYLALYREQQRWDDVPFQGWAPRWLQVALQIDLSRRRVTSGERRPATIAEVNSWFADAGVSMTWYLDTPSWGTTIPYITTTGNLSAGASGTLSALPAEVDILLAPVGKFAMIDRAQVSLGVTGNNWYRDNASNKVNEVTYFVENYEGVVDTTSCPAHLVNFQTLCYNGAQIDDEQINCVGVAG